MKEFKLFFRLFYAPCSNARIFFAFQIKLCSWGHLTTIFLKILYIMGYNVKKKTARNGKSISKMLKWPSSRPLGLQNKLICQFQFSENLQDLYAEFCRRARSCSSTKISFQIFSFFFLNLNPSFFNARGIKLDHYDVLSHYD